MTNAIHTALVQALPAKRKQRSDGWTSLSGPCCVPMGESRPDRRSRGGYKTTPEGGFQWHCFNCGFKANFTPGYQLNYKMKQFMRWLGMDQYTIQKLGIEAMRLQQADAQVVQKPVLNIVPKKLPGDAKPIAEWSTGDMTDPYLLKVMEYIQTRGLYLDDYDWHWSSDEQWRDRLIIPFYWKNQIVGSTARSVFPTEYKYIMDSQKGYVFNLDKQDWNRKFVIVTEGPIDAIMMEGVSVLGSTVNDLQKDLINSLNRQVIVVPDRDEAGTKLIEQAKQFGWNVAFPDWSDNIKDIGDAVKHYGKLMTLRMILASVERTALKIDLVKDMWLQ